MIICRTPFRISLFGGGTDFPKYYLKNEGCVIGGTIDKYCYVTARFLPNVFDYKHRIVWSENETVNKYNEINNPVVRAIFRKLKIKKGLEVHYQGDLQKNSGLGTSSSFCVGLLNSLSCLHKYKTSKKKLALDAMYVEQLMLHEDCGSQDQIFSAYGGFNFIKFKKNGEFSVTKLKISHSNFEKLNNNFLLIYTGIQRYSNNIEKIKVRNIDKNLNNLDEIKKITLNFKKIISSDNSIDGMGEMLNDYWFLKKSLTKKVTNTYIDEIYNIALSSGASGGKVIGSGGGGYILVYCDKKYQKKLKKNLKKLSIIDFKFTSEGSKIIFQNNQ